uniref:Ribosomal protein L16 n=1 Tax=Tetrahymena thermophila TaxID=5911 RepID=Q951A0_TETTH|nr:ribosomal protein L16 [Tetrahymena thermophila]AAK77583.1 ribosomal protein L16 [Tetrahymena thermophila]6Z1P_Ar Chain Ar, Ribosomal protein L16 [Tetrahymena thermophila SB210]
MRFKNLSNTKQVSFKLRNFKKTTKYRLVFGNSMILLYKNARFESIYFELFRKYIKVISKKKNININYRNCWIFLRMNTPLTKKSKNSRMGKGKGALYRWLVRLPKHYKLLEFKNVNYYRLNFLTKKWSKRLSLPLAFVSKANL